MEVIIVLTKTILADIQRRKSVIMVNLLLKVWFIVEHHLHVLVKYLTGGIQFSALLSISNTFLISVTLSALYIHVISAPNIFHKHPLL